MQCLQATQKLFVNYVAKNVVISVNLHATMYVAAD